MATTKAETTYHALNKLTEGGLSFADAVRKYAEENGSTEGAVRGNYYNHRKKVDGSGETPARGRRRGRSAAPVSVDDAIAEAKRLLQGALERIDDEVATAKAEADAAQERYERLAAQVADRKAELERKIAAL